MNNLPDGDYRRAYQAFNRQHDAQRSALLQMLPSSNVMTQAAEARVRRGMPMSTTLVAALLLLAASAAFFKLVSTERVYGIEGLNKRLMAVRSLHIKGWIYTETTTEFGKATLRFPTEEYYARTCQNYHTGYGFSSNGDKLVQVTKSAVVCDGDRTMRIDHDQKRATIVPADKLKTELGIEGLLQQSFVNFSKQGSSKGYELVGVDRIGDLRCDVYEHVDPADKPVRFRQRLWLNPDDGMPVRLMEYHITADGDEPFSDSAEIHVNVDPPPGMFSFTAPKGYETIRNADAKVNRSMMPAGGGGSKTLWCSTGIAINIDDRAVLLCWSQLTKIENGSAWFEKKPTFSLLTAESRPCDEITLRTDVVGDQQCRWSLIVPRDGRPVGVASVGMVCRDVNTTSSGGSQPLEFAPSRIAELVEEIQRRTLPADAPADEVWTLEELRAKLHE